MQKSKALPSLSVRIDLDPEGRIGPGKIALLEHIDKCGSISAAGRAMEMSYKRAWDLVDEINRICRQGAADRRQERRRRGIDAVRSLAGDALPQDRTCRDQLGAQGVAGIAERDRQAEESRALIATGIGG
jgi:molybdate transport system regulatory protein